MKSPAHLLLFCDMLNRKFVLRDEGKDWSMTFDNWDGAHMEAIRRVSVDTPLTIYNERGKEIASGSVSPSWENSGDI